MKQEKEKAAKAAPPIVIHMEDGVIEAIDGLPKGTKIQLLDYTLNLDPDYEPCTCKTGTRDHTHLEVTAQ